MGSKSKLIIWPKIVLFGDSLIQRSFEPRDGLWATLLTDRLQRHCDVIGRGFSGYTTRLCKLILPRLFSDEHVAHIRGFVICLGANDSSLPSSKQHVPIEEYKENLTGMIDYLVNIGLKKENIILMTPPPYHHEKYVAYCQETGHDVPLRDNTVVSKYAEACCEVAQACKVDIVNLYKEMIKDENWPRFLVDGLHFSHTGSALVYALLWPYIDKRIDSSKMILPAWNEIDMENPEKYLLT